MRIGSAEFGGGAIGDDPLGGMALGDEILWPNEPIPDPPVHVASGTVTPRSQANAVQVPIPTSGGIAAGTVDVVFIAFSSALPIITMPSGMNFLGKVEGHDGGARNTALHVFWRRPVASSGNYSFTFNGTYTRRGLAFRFTGCATEGNPFEASHFPPYGDYSDAPATSLSTEGANRLLLWAAMSWDTNNINRPSGTTQLYMTSGDSPSLTVAYRVQETAGATGSITSSTINASSINACLAALKPA